MSNEYCWTGIYVVGIFTFYAVNDGVFTIVICQ